MVRPFVVLILVVMDDALVLKRFIKGLILLLVLILVVMDDALVQTSFKRKSVKTSGLNPCCNG